jgi:hypothetical protein
MKELLIIVRNSKDMLGYYGLCLMTLKLRYDGIINENEETKIDNYINRNSSKIEGTEYRWLEGEWEPRLKWLNEQIAKLDK